MWSPERRTALAALAAAATLGGCGFRPLYGTGGGGEALRGAMIVDAGEGRLGWTFTEAMRGRVGDPGAQAPYRLEVALALEEEGLAISERDDVTRIALRGQARYALEDRATKAELARGVARGASGYSTLASPYATRTARLDAERRVIEDLATRVWIDLVAAIESRGA